MRTIALISGGIDSPVAAYLMAERGSEVILLHMDNRPYSDDRSLVKVKDVASVLRKATGQNMPLLIAEHGSNQTDISRSCDRRYQCVLCKRLMLATAERVAESYGAEALIMGDSLGQVASQTLHNIKASSAGLRMPVLRPLIGLDKLEIEALAKHIGTYEISIGPEQSCLAVPPKPATMASPENMRDMESRLDLGMMVERTIASMTVNDP